MTIPTNDNFLLKASVKRSYSINTNPDLVFEYLSDIKRLLKNIPDLNRLQFYANSGRARLFCSMRVLALTMNAIVDLESEIETQTRTIKLTKSKVPLGAIPDGFLVGTFGAGLAVTESKDHTTHIRSSIMLGFDPTQLEMVKGFPRSLLETPGQLMLQDFVEQTSLNYINKLAQEFPNWQRSLKQA